MSFFAYSRTALLLVSAAAMLAGCDTIREATGADKSAPDEFAVVTKAPLILPPEYNLRPPQPGAAPLNQPSPAGAAEAALYGADTMTVANSMPGSMSSGERLLLAHANVQNANPQIRAQIAADGRDLQGANESFTNDVLFWNSPKTDTGRPVNADAEAQRLEAAKAGSNTSGAQYNTAPAPQAQPAPAQPEEKKDEGGWFDWF
jgi:hypothetical protein